MLTSAAVSWAPDNRLALALEHVVSESAPWTLDESTAASHQPDIGALIRDRASAGYGFNVTNTGAYTMQLSVRTMFNAPAAVSGRAAVAGQRGHGATGGRQDAGDDLGVAAPYPRGLAIGGRV